MNSHKRFLLALLAWVALPAAAMPIPDVATEYVHKTTGRFLLFKDLGPGSGNDVGADWEKTGYHMQVGVLGSGATPVVPVCHFLQRDTGAHFYTAVAEECAFLRDNDTGWSFVDTPFQAALPRGDCGAWSPVYRLYNNRWMFNDSMHRYTPDAKVRARLLAQGWIDEGIAFCTFNWSHQPLVGGEIYSPDVATGSIECVAGGARSCIAVNHMPALSNRVQSFFMRPWRSPVSEYPIESHAVTGMSYEQSYWPWIATAQELAYPSAVVAHSFVQVDGRSLGIHVNSADRRAGDYASIDPRFQLAAPETVWGRPRNPYLDVSFLMKVQTLTRADAQSHAYGGPVVTLVDRESGLSLYVAIVAYGTITPAGGEETAGRDAHTGRVMVATTFFAPSFGERVTGEWVACSGAGACDSSEAQRYRFRLDRNAFEVVLARARALEPRLSPDVDNYLLSGFEMRNEVYRDGRIGLWLAELQVGIFSE